MESRNVLRIDDYGRNNSLVFFRIRHSRLDLKGLGGDKIYANRLVVRSSSEFG